MSPALVGVNLSVSALAGVAAMAGQALFDFDFASMAYGLFCGMVLAFAVAFAWLTVGGTA